MSKRKGQKEEEEGSGKSSPLRIIFRASGALHAGAYGHAKGGQDKVNIGPHGTQDGATSKTKTETIEGALEDRLGAVLGRSWVEMDAVLGSKSCCGCSGARFFENQLFEENEGSRGDLARSWVDLEGQEAPK